MYLLVFQAGYNSTGNNNVFIGYRAGYTETGSNKLYIGSDNSTLIYGDFSLNYLSLGAEGGNIDIFGNLAVLGRVELDSLFIDGTLTNDNGTLTWNGVAVGSGNGGGGSFNGGIVANATTFNAAVTMNHSLALAGDLNLDGGTLANSGGTLTWNGTAITSGASYLYVDNENNIKFGPSSQLFSSGILDGNNGLRQNTSVGANNMTQATTADGNTAVGFIMPCNHTTGNGNTAMGNGALQRGR